MLAYKYNYYCSKRIYRENPPLYKMLHCRNKQTCFWSNNSNNNNKIIILIHLLQTNSCFPICYINTVMYVCFYYFFLLFKFSKIVFLILNFIEYLVLVFVMKIIYLRQSHIICICVYSLRKRRMKAFKKKRNGKIVWAVTRLINVTFGDSIAHNNYFFVYLFYSVKRQRQSIVVN